MATNNASNAPTSNMDAFKLGMKNWWTGNIDVGGNISGVLTEISNQASQAKLPLNDLTRIFEANKNAFTDIQFQNGINYLQKLSAEGKLTTLTFEQFKEAIFGSSGQSIFQQLGASIKGMAVNFVASAAITAAVSVITNAYKYLDERQQKTIEAGMEAAEVIQTEKEAYQSNAKYIQEYADRYYELSKGVTASGKNVSLTSAEYQEFQGIQNEIANRFPELVAGYDSLGNAILNVGTNVDSLNEALANQETEWVDKSISSTKAILDGFAESSKYKSSFFDDVQTGGLYKASRELFNALNSGEGLNATATDELAQVLDELGIAYVENEGKITTSSLLLQKNAQSIISSYRQYTNEANELASSMRELGKAYLYTNDYFNSLSSEDQGYYSQIIDKLSFDFFDEQSFDSSTEVQNWIDSFIGSIGSNSLQDELENILVLDPRDITKANVDAVKQSIAAVGQALGMESNSESMKQFYNSFGLNPEQLEASYNAAFDHIKKNRDKIDFGNQRLLNIEASLETKEIKKWLKTLTATELDIVANFELTGTESVSQLQAMLNSAIFSAKTLSEFKIETSTLTSGLEAIKTATTELNTSGQITDETMSALKSAFGDVSSLLTYTTEGIVMNTSALADLADQAAQTQLLELEMREALDVDVYQEKTAELKQYTDAHKGLAEALQTGELEEYQASVEGTVNAISDLDLAIASNLYDETSALAANINGFDQLEIQIRATTSALNEWLRAKETANASDNAQTAAGGLKEAQDILNRGMVGQDDFTKYIDYIGSYEQSDDNYIPENAQEFIDRASKYLTVDSSGNITREGFDNFYDLLESQKINLKDFNIDDIAQKTDFTTSFVTDMLLGMIDAGYEVDFRSMTDGMVDGIHSIDETSADARTNLESFREQINKLAEAGADVTELESAYSALESEINKAEAHTSIDLTTTSFSNLKDIALASAKELKNIFAETNTGFDFSLTGISEIAEYENYIEQFQDLKVGLDVDTPQYEYVQTILAYLIKSKQELETPAVMNLDSSNYSAEMSNALNLLQQYQTLQNEIEYNEALGIDTSSAQTELENVISKINELPEEVQSTLKITNGTTEEIEAAIGNPEIETTIKPYLAPEAVAGTVTVDADNTPAKQKADEAKTYADGLISKMTHDADNSLAKDAADSAETYAEGLDVDIPIDGNTNLLKTSINSALSGTFRINVAATVTGLPSGGGVVNGTAHAQGNAIVNRGSAFADGNWGLKHNVSSALMGELGPEIVVRNGKWFTVGENGAEFVGGLRKGDIIFNHKQSEELLENGYVTSGGGRGRALAEGTAFATTNSNVNAGVLRPSWMDSSPSSSPSSSKNSSPKSSSNQAAKDAEETAEKLDWIEVLLQRIQRDIDNLDKTASATFKSWTERNTALSQEMSKVNEEIKYQLEGYERYLQEAESVGLDPEYAKKVQAGLIDIESIEDEDLREQISEYQEWYEKALDCSDAVKDLQQNLADLARQRFDNVMQEYEDRMSVIEHNVTMIEGMIDQTEAKGYIVGASYYEVLKEEQNSIISDLQSQRSDLMKTLNEEVAAGRITLHSEEWYSMMQEIWGVDEAIQEAESSIIDLDNNLRQLEWDAFDKGQEMISRLTDESEFYLDLISNEKMFDSETGKITEHGLTSYGLHSLNYHTLMAQADDYAKEMADINAELANDPNNQTLLDRKEELINLQRESVLAAEDEKQAMLDLASEGFDNFLNVMDGVIDKHTEWLNLTKDLYDYEKNVTEQVKDLASLEKQRAALEGDTSESARAQIQKLDVQIEDARKNLEETQYDKYIQDQEQMLESMRQDTESYFNSRLENPELLLSEMIATANTNANTIKTTLEAEADAVGVTLSDNMSAIWDVEGSGFGSAVSEYCKGFSSQLTTTNSILDQIRLAVESMYNDANKDGQGKVDDQKNKTSNDLKDPAPTPPAPTPTPHPETTPETNTSNTSSDVSIGGKINAGNARIYANSNGTGGGKQYFANDPIYTVIDEENGYYRVRWHKASSGSTGWFKKSDVKAYKKGGLLDETGLFWGDGTKSAPEIVLDARDSRNFVELRDELRERNSLNYSPVSSLDSISLEQMEAFQSIYSGIDYLHNVMDNINNTVADAVNKTVDVISQNRDINVDRFIGEINMYGMNDPNEFTHQLESALKNNTTVKRIIRSDTLGLAMGRNSLSSFAY